jgi:hypothetical protein
MEKCLQNSGEELERAVPEKAERPEGANEAPMGESAERKDMEEKLKESRRFLEQINTSFDKITSGQMGLFD